MTVPSPSPVSVQQVLPDPCANLWMHAYRLRASMVPPVSIIRVSPTGVNVLLNIQGYTVRVPTPVGRFPV